jgi:hypothetical protein
MIRPAHFFPSEGGALRAMSVGRNSFSTGHGRRRACASATRWSRVSGTGSDIDRLSDLALAARARASQRRAAILESLGDEVVAPETDPIRIQSWLHGRAHMLHSSNFIARKSRPRGRAGSFEKLHLSGMKPIDAPR